MGFHSPRLAADAVIPAKAGIQRLLLGLFLGTSQLILDLKGLMADS